MTVKRRLAVLAAALIPAAAGLVATVPAQAAPASLIPGCQRVIVQENSGNGPDWHLIVCGGMKPWRDGFRWVCVVDGGPLVNHR